MEAPTANALDPAAIAVQYAATFVDSLSDCGLRDVCICPGSRSTPLTLAFASNQSVRTWTHIDERSAAFFALGMAKGLRRPVAIVCTSGTAAANFLPAVVEAHYSSVPLILLTADRPPELRDTGALQAIDQVKLYGTFVKWFVDMALPEEGLPSNRYARDIAAHAFTVARSDPSGPVHINCPFREPLVPRADPIVRRASSFAARDDVPPYLSTPPSDNIIRSLATEISHSTRGLLVCGPQDDPSFPDAVSTLSRVTGFPILADPMSQLRAGRDSDVFVFDNYDLFLRSSSATTELKPDLVLRFGMTPTSKPLVTYLSQLEGVLQVSVQSQSQSNDPSRSVTKVLSGDPALVCTRVASLDGLSRDYSTEWSERWHRISNVTRLVVDARLAATTGLSEPKVFQMAAEVLSPNSLLFVGNSMPIRDLDAFFPCRQEPLWIGGNRGANGIDGVVSTALGAGAARGARIVLIIGDLSFYHDMNGLLAAMTHQIDVTVILLNNNGGGIFDFLPQAQHAETFEQFFAMPTGLNFRGAVEMYGGRFESVETMDALSQLVEPGAATPGLTVLEVRTNRQENVRVHKAIWEAVDEALGEMPGGPPS